VVVAEIHDVAVLVDRKPVTVSDGKLGRTTVVVIPSVTRMETDWAVAARGSASARMGRIVVVR